MLLAMSALGTTNMLSIALLCVAQCSLCDATTCETRDEPPAPTPCPEGWVSGAGGSKCYISPPRLARHSECASVCLAQGHQAALTCVGNDDENAVLANWASSVAGPTNYWIGLHRTAASMDTEEWESRWAAHDTCGARTHWTPSANGHAPMGREDCVSMNADGTWQIAGCHRKYRCLCELHARTQPTYAAEIGRLEKRADADAWRVATTAFEYYCLLVLLPLIVICTRRLAWATYLDLQRKVAAVRSAWERMREFVQSSRQRAPLPLGFFLNLGFFFDAPPPDGAIGLDEFTIGAGQRPRPPRPSATEKEVAVRVGRAVKLLRLSKLHFAEVRLRTSHIIAQLGWMLMLAGWVPMVTQYVGRDWPVSALGPFMSYLPLVPIGGLTFGMAIQPADSTVIRLAAYSFFTMWLGLGVVCALIAHAYASDSRYSRLIPLVYAIVSPLNFGCAVQLGRSIYRWRAAPRLLLLSNWALGRFLCTTAGFLMLAGLVIWLIVDPVFAPQDPYLRSLAATALTFAFTPLAFTPTRRSQLRNRLASGSSCCMKPQQSFLRQHHALAASLVKMRIDLAPEAALELAQRHFLCCILRVKPAQNGEKWTGNLLANLISTRQPAQYGIVDAFISHSQHDDERLKWRALEGWATAFHAMHGRWPLVWFDRACLDDHLGGAHAQESLAALPLMVGGCKQLLCLAGPTYASRLWALVEILAFLWSQEEGCEQLEVLPLIDDLPPDDGLPPAHAAAHAEEEALSADGQEMALLGSFRTVDVTTSQCAYNEDRQLMLAAIESSFGTAHRLNARLRSVLVARGRINMRTHVMHRNVRQELAEVLVDKRAEDGDFGASGGAKAHPLLLPASPSATASPATAPAPAPSPYWVSAAERVPREIIEERVLPHLGPPDLLSMSAVNHEWLDICSSSSRSWACPIASVVLRMVMKHPDAKRYEMAFYSNGSAARDNRVQWAVDDMRESPAAKVKWHALWNVHFLLRQTERNVTRGVERDLALPEGLLRRFPLSRYNEDDVKEVAEALTSSLAARLQSSGCDQRRRYALCEMRCRRSKDRDHQAHFGFQDIAATMDELWYVWTFVAVMVLMCVDAFAHKSVADSYMHKAVQAIFNSTGQLRERNPRHYATREEFIRDHPEAARHWYRAQARLPGGPAR